MKTDSDDSQDEIETLGEEITRAPNQERDLS